MKETADFFSNFSNSVPVGTVNFTFKVTSRMVVTIMKKNKMVKIKSGSEDVFNSGISRLPPLLNRPISLSLHNF